MNLEQRLKPQLGKFYRSTDGQIWCCFRSRPLVKSYGTHTQSYCVRVSDCHHTYFLDDRGFGESEDVEHLLVEEVDPKDVPEMEPAASNLG